MASQAAGAEFLERRLARATAVPPAERSPEVAAFVELMQLLREVAQLLPLTPDGCPALPDTPATRRKVGCPAATCVQPTCRKEGVCKQPRPAPEWPHPVRAGAAGGAEAGAR